MSRERENMVEPIKVGRFIAQNRKNLNLTQKELAEKLGVTDGAVSKWSNLRAWNCSCCHFNYLKKGRLLNKYNLLDLGSSSFFLYVLS